MSYVFVIIMLFNFLGLSKFLLIIMLDILKIVIIFIEGRLQFLSFFLEKLYLLVSVDDSIYEEVQQDIELKGEWRYRYWLRREYLEKDVIIKVRRRKVLSFLRWYFFFCIYGQYLKVYMMIVRGIDVQQSIMKRLNVIGLVVCLK